MFCYFFYIGIDTLFCEMVIIGFFTKPFDFFTLFNQYQQII